MALAHESRMLVDGALIASSSGATFPNVNPATEEAVGSCADGTLEDASRAVAAARRAFDETDWATDHKLRRRCLEQLQSALEEAKEDLRATIVAEAGSPVALTYSVQVDYPVAWPGWFAQLADSYAYESALPVTEFLGQPQRGLRVREPAGVVTCITPFNFPLYLNLAKVAPALAAGCTVILKPSPETPFTATLMGRLIAERTDIPPGVLNVVTSTSTEVSESLVIDPRVDMVSFTGSTATGRKIMAACAPQVKKCFLELGGKSANVILDDADLAVACALAVGYSCAHAGQGCALYTRLLLPRSRYDEGVAVLQAMFGTTKAGDPADPGVLVGPVINEAQRQRVLDLIATGQKEGASLLAGGGIPADLPTGYFVEPTLFVNVRPEAAIAQEEIFGPVLSVIPYEDDEGAVRIANDSIYGLSGSVWSASEERAMAVARRIRTGTVSVNGGNWLDVSRPFGGYKQSGLGRENGLEGFEEYLQTKVVGLPG